MAENDACGISMDDSQSAASDALSEKPEEREAEGQKTVAAGADTPSPATTSIKAVLWEVIKPVATIGIVVSVVGAIALYVYLHRVGWPELLQPSLASKTGIAVVVISLVIVLISLTLTMYGSAYWANLVAHSYDQPSSIPRKLPSFAIAVHILWIVLLAIWMLGFSGEKSYAWTRGVKEHIHEWLFAYFAVVALASICCHWWARRNEFDVVDRKSGFMRRSYDRLKGLFPSRSDDSGKLTWRIVQEDVRGRGKRIAQDALRGTMLALGSVFASTASCVFVEINPSIGSLDVTVWNSLIVCCATLPGIVVGVSYIVRYRASGSIKTSLKDVATFAVVMGIAACTMFPTITLLPLDTLSLGAASVFSETEHHYALERRHVWALYEKVGFRAIDPDVKEDSPIVFKAYERYRMGDILLLCTQPNAAVRGDEKPKATGHTASNSVSGKPAVASAVVVSDTAVGHEGCIQAERGEVRRVEIAQ
jgi:hypothetical protein